MNHRLRILKQQAAERLRSPEGIARRKNRCADVEPVFANIKHNKGFRRFMLRGIGEVLMETGADSAGTQPAKTHKSPISLKNNKTIRIKGVGCLMNLSQP
ncbi:transposase [Niabella hibiscisoli]|uniref:transposase n=1 Tax=Niabella hibiscisoli TaxID=1825928 RepID=UPI00374D7A64